MKLELPGGEYEIFPEVWKIYEDHEDKAYRTAWLIEQIQAEVARQIAKKQREATRRLYAACIAYGWADFAERMKVALDGIIDLIDPEVDQ